MKVIWVNLSSRPGVYHYDKSCCTRVRGAAVMIPTLELEAKAVGLRLCSYCKNKELDTADNVAPTAVGV